MKSKSHSGSPVGGTLLASALLASVLWAVSPSPDRTGVAPDVAPPPARGVAGTSVFFPGQAPTAAPDLALLSAADIERSLPRTFGAAPALPEAAA